MQCCELFNEFDEFFKLNYFYIILHIFYSDMGNPNLSIEDYLNRLVQEDDIVKNRSKADSNKIGYVPGSNPPNLSQVSIFEVFENFHCIKKEHKLILYTFRSRDSATRFLRFYCRQMFTKIFLRSFLSQMKPTVGITVIVRYCFYPIKSTGVCFSYSIIVLLQDNVRGPYSAMDMIEFFNANFFHSYTLMRKGIGPHFETFARLFDLCGGMPFLYSDQVALNSCFVSDVFHIMFRMNRVDIDVFEIFHSQAVPYLPVSPNMHKMFQENNPPPSHPSTSNKPSMPVKVLLLTLNVQYYWFELYIMHIFVLNCRIS